MPKIKRMMECPICNGTGECIACAEVGDDGCCECDGTGRIKDE